MLQSHSNFKLTENYLFDISRRKCAEISILNAILQQKLFAFQYAVDTYKVGKARV